MSGAASEVVVLGTGSADGWPNPFCTCASCSWALTAGVVRGHTAALVDRTLLLDMGPDVARSASRAGVSLAEVRHVLVTHAHPDHLAPMSLLWRSWARSTSPLVVAGPRAVVDACREWVGPHDPVQLLEVAAGDVLDLDDATARVLAAAHGGDSSGDAVLYDVTSATGARLLWATDTGPLPLESLDAVASAGRGGPFDLVLLEETFGDLTDHDADHLDLATFPRQLAVLRARGVVDDATDVVAVHLGHHNPPGDELDRRLSLWGARTVPDGTTLQVRSRTGSVGSAPDAVAGRASLASPLPRRTLILGGARSGKSREAERRFAARDDVVYVATALPRPDDGEWQARVATHRARRPSTWETRETTDVSAAVRDARPGQPVLVDCLALWTGLLVDRDDVEVDKHLRELTDALRQTGGDVVLVSNEVGSGVVPATESGRRFRDILGRVNAEVAAVVDEVVLVVAGIPTTLKQAPAVQPSEEHL